MITALIAILLSFLFNQYFTEDRKKKEIVDRIIIELKTDIEDDYLYVINKNTDIDILRTKIRRIQNNIDLLKNIRQNYIKQNDPDYISTQFSTYNELIDDKITDFDYLEKSQKSLKRNLDLIGSKLNLMRTDLYGLNKK